MKKINTTCDPQDVAVKSFFLGPSAENREWLFSQVVHILNNWFSWRENFSEGHLISEGDKCLKEFKEQQKWTDDVISDISQRFEAEIPKFSPRYIGHMFSEISMPALLGHIITLLHNPNNISSEASKVGTEIEKEAIGFLKDLLGFQTGVGHFTSGGTVANFEFLFRARERLTQWVIAAALSGEKDIFKASTLGWRNFGELKFDEEYFAELQKGTLWSSWKKLSDQLGFELKAPVLLASSSKHYSWPKAMHYLGLGEENLMYVDLDSSGRMSLEDLANKMDLVRRRNSPLLGVVGICGTTELGTLDPIRKITQLLESRKSTEGEHVWLHLDAAFGGFFRALVGSQYAGSVAPEIMENLECMSRADSITLDPHKMGYVPYASGAFVCKNPEDYFIKSFTGPYIVSDRHNLGNFTIEGSRSAAGAVATYASMKAFQGSDGYARILGRTMRSKEIFKEQLQAQGLRLLIPEGLDANILCFSVLTSEKSLKRINQRNLEIYEKIEEGEKYWISKTTLNKSFFGALINSCCQKNKIEVDTDELVLLRLTLMNPFVVSKESPIDHASSFATSIQKIIGP